eukprot:GILK01000109.1.p1 GENE.GILK01000109.1~~GILK01000109.1.p1  ORF type:complete len:288 (-),score=48.99 GILK01000109.1:270-1133(-)
MSVELPLYKDLNKSLTDVLTEDYAFDKQFTLKVKTKTSNGLEYVAGGNITHSKAVVGNLQTKYKHGLSGLSLDVKGATDGKQTLEVKLADKVPGTTFIVGATQAPGKAAFEGSVGVEYKHDLARVKATVDLANGPTISTSLVSGRSGVLVGADASYNTEKGQLTNYNGALGYNFGDNVFLLQTKTVGDKMAGQLSASYFHLVNKGLRVGGDFGYTLHNNAKIFTLGTQYTLDPTSAVKAKVDSEGKVCVHFQNKINSGVTFGLSTQLDATNFSNDSTKLGFSLTFEN